MTLLRPLSVAALLVLAPAPVVAADGSVPPPPPQAGEGINGNLLPQAREGINESPHPPAGENGSPPPLAAEGAQGGVPSPLAEEPLERLSATRDRPLFSPSRRPPPPPPPVVHAPEPPPPPPPPPAVALFGIVMDGQGTRAVVRASPTDKITRVSIGDDIGGWKVSQIEGRRLVLSLGDQTATFTMFVGNRANKAPPVGAEAPAANTPPQPQNQIRQNGPAPSSAGGSPNRHRSPRAGG